MLTLLQSEKSLLGMQYKFTVNFSSKMHPITLLQVDSKNIARKMYSPPTSFIFVGLSENADDMGGVLWRKGKTDE